MLHQKQTKPSMLQWQFRCDIKYISALFIAMALIVAIWEIPSMNTKSITLETHQFLKDREQSSAPPAIPQHIIPPKHQDLMSNDMDRAKLLMDSNRNDELISTFHDKTVLITGIAGFIGMSLATQLSNKTHFPSTKVIGIDTFNTYYIPKLKRERAQRLLRMDVDVIFGDLCDEQLLLNIFDEYDISIIVHLAAQAGVRYSIQFPHSYVHNNIDCTVTLLEMVKNKSLSIPIVYASSSSIYGDNDFKQEPLRDTGNINNYKPKSVYAASKVATENMATVYSKMYKLNMVGLRFFTVYGSYGRPDMALWSFTDRLLQNKKIKLYNHGEMMRDFTHWSDIVNGIQLAMKYAFDVQKETSPNQWGTNEIFNLGKGNVRSLYEFVKIILSELGMSDDIDHNPLITLAPTPGGEVLFTSADLTKSKSMLGYNPQTELEVGIPEFIHWYRNDWKWKEDLHKKYLLISTFYISMKKTINTSITDVEYIQEWYSNIKQVMNIDDVSRSQVDIVIIHDGLSSDVFNYFPDVIFVNMGKAKRQNEVRYGHIANYLHSSDENEYQVVVISDMNDIKFSQDQFQQLDHIEFDGNTDLYLAFQQIPDQSWKSKWYDFLKQRLSGCYKEDVVNKCMNWMDVKPHDLPSKTGIIAGNKQLILMYLDEVQYQLERVEHSNTTSEQDCDHSAILVSIIELCVEDKECNLKSFNI